MSVYTGQFGVLKVDGVAVAELRSFSVSTTTEVIENTTMGDNSRSYFAGLKSFEGTADIFFEEEQLAADVTAGSFETGKEYEIITAGTTDFTLIGAADSVPGTVFTATDVGTGTGTARRTNVIVAFRGGTNQSASTTRDDKITFEAYPNGTSTGEPKINGNIIISAYNISSSLDGMVEASISFSGTGDVTLNNTAS